MQKYDAPDVDSYIAASDPAARNILQELRKIINAAIPGVEEKISWGVPFYRYHGAIGGFATYKKHVSFGCGNVDLPEELRAELAQQGYKTGSRTIQIQFDQAVPVATVKRLVKAQAQANQAKKATDS